MTDSTFRDRVVAEIKRRGWSMAEAARQTGVTYDVIRELHRKSTTTTAENAEKLRRVLFDAPSIRLEQPRPMLVRVDHPDDAPEGTRLVPVYDVHASAGHGAIAETELVAHSLAFPPAYLSRLTSSRPENLAIISVKGESMEPTLLDDDIVLLDASKTSLSYDGLFVLRFDDALHVKRVGRSARKGHIMIISDNSALYPPLEAAVVDIEPIGKVLWYGRKV